MFESMIMQTDIIASVTALVIAITGIVGTIASLMLGVGNRIKTSSHDQRLIKLGNEFVSIGQLGTAFSQKTSEHMSDMETVLSVFMTLSPEAKKALEAQGKGIAYWEQRARIAKLQLDRLLPVVDASGQANAIVDLPRESNITKVAND